MMKDHISLEEMVEFITSNHVNDRFRELSRRINAHVHTCENCREQYNNLLLMQDALKELSGTLDKEEMLRVQILHSLYRVKDKDSCGNEVVESWIKNIADLRATLHFKINESQIVELEHDSALSGFRRVSGGKYFRGYQNVLKDKDGYLESDSISVPYEDMTFFPISGKHGPKGNYYEKKQPKTHRCILADDKMNRIELQPDGRLSFYFTPDICGAGVWAMLMPEEQTDLPQFKQAENVEQGLVKITYEKIKPEKYTLVIDGKQLILEEFHKE